MFRSSEPVPVVGVAPDAAPTTCIEISQAWIPVLIGVTEFMLWRDFWLGSVSEVDQAVSHAVQLIGLLVGQECQTVDYVKVYEDRETAGGSSVVGFQTRTLDSVAGNTDLVSLSSNEFTPVAGTYILRAQACAFGVRQHRICIFGDNPSLPILTGDNAYTRPGSTYPTQTLATLEGRLISDGEEALRLEHYTRDAQPSNGLGSAPYPGVTAVFSSVSLIKIS